MKLLPLMNVFVQVCLFVREKCAICYHHNDNADKVYGDSEFSPVKVGAFHRVVPFKGSLVFGYGIVKERKVLIRRCNARTLCTGSINFC